MLGSFIYAFRMILISSLRIYQCKNVALSTVSFHVEVRSVRILNSLLSFFMKGSLRKLDTEVAKRLECSANLTAAVNVNGSAKEDEQSAALLSALEIAFREGDARTAVECYVSLLRADRTQLLTVCKGQVSGNSSVIEADVDVDVDQQLDLCIRRIQRGHVARAQESNASAARCAVLESELNALRERLADSVASMTMKNAGLSGSATLNVSRVGSSYAYVSNSL